MALHFEMDFHSCSSRDMGNTYNCFVNTFSLLKYVSLNVAVYMRNYVGPWDLSYTNSSGNSNSNHGGSGNHRGRNSRGVDNWASHFHSWDFRLLICKMEELETLETTPEL